MATIEIRKFGRTLTTREAGRKAHDLIRPVVEAEHVTFDFAGVELVTNSWADETFARMAADMGLDAFKARTHFANVRPTFARVIRAAIDSRAS